MARGSSRKPLSISMIAAGPLIGHSLRDRTPPVSGTDRPFTYSDHVKARQMIMSDSKFFDGAKDEANSSPSGTPAGGNVPFLSMNNQLQMSVEPEKNINLNFECGLLKRAQKRQRRNLEEEKEKSNGARSPAAGKNCGT
uniref:Uncharacterized protein n=1 Tax=Salix viminalis TaxID=40686 RepID=A0A6N2M900_SALVM